MYLLGAAQGALHTGDIIFQLMMFISLLFIPLVILVVFLIVKKRNNRLKRVEEKLDQLLSEKNEKQ
ncbi:hypothetical protein SAMN05192533_11833 [Mesobacillus persicus]|uniref:DUF4083 domain-containing protein n=1 Tax=Mesobacillus persicus TaxID=930146 RepID=A0A1H8IS86_9BACI|nr:hypothetical protein [Mesobacillus persicus]SEN71241.1 hypothetical protein SAMN05192533_11833 [Mesobacillus persicus]